MFLRLCRSVAAAAVLASICPISGLAQEASAQASLSVQGRPTVYRSVVAVRGKSLNAPRIIVIATVKPLTAKQFQQVLKANAEGTQTLEGDASYIKASFR